jgi:hypothetical protein
MPPLTQEFSSHESSSAVRESLLTKITPWAMQDWRFTIKLQTEETLTITRRYLPGWALLVGIITLPGLVGLLLLIFYRREDTVTFTIVPAEAGGTRVLVNGVADRGFAEDLQRRLTRLTADTTPSATFEAGTNSGTNLSTSESNSEQDKAHR